ncbi:MAG: SDR family NAD(P)-dependent oxidoreductase [Eubacteriaceae bacterium]|nr:SDR family NAD(P)-dependent oxidoreductase [Eubacteriaceae bacterium]
MLKGKTAIVTGGTRGIGEAVVRTFLENGATVTLFGSREETVNRALEKLHKTYSDRQVSGMWPDLAEYDPVAKALDEVADKQGKIDIMVNNAGISSAQPLSEYKPEDFKKIMDLNVTAVFNCCKAAAALMKQQGGGVILNTSSMVSLYGQPRGVGYPASKFAVNGITKSLARELGADNIRVNAVAPGVVETDMLKALPEEMQKAVISKIPLKRPATPQDIANAFLFLASDLASYVSGEILSVDGATMD